MQNLHAVASGSLENSIITAICSAIIGATVTAFFAWRAASRKRQQDLAERADTNEVLSRRDVDNMIRELLAEKNGEIERLRVEVEQLRDEVADLANERAQWQVERDTFQGERNAWQRERDAFQAERAGFERKMRAWEKERATLLKKLKELTTQVTGIEERSTSAGAVLAGSTTS